jgi:hypothetical protein
MMQVRRRLSTRRCHLNRRKGRCVVLFQFKPSSNEFKLNSICFNFDRPKKDFSKLEKFETTYGCEGFEERNNFLYRNFSRFGMDFK